MMRPLLVSLVIAVLWSQHAHAYKSTDKVVQDLVAKGVAYLKKDHPAKHGFGEEVLIGYALFKAGQGDHPKVKKALNTAIAKTSSGTLQLPSKHFTYEASVALILLSEVGGHRREAKIYTDSLLKSQLGDGSWTYPDENAGDTSQTQYAVLALWAVSTAGVEIPVANVDRALAWFIKTQAPSGGFLYRPPSGKRRTLNHTLGAGGTGSLYVGAYINHIQLYQQAKDEKESPGIKKKAPAKTSRQSSLNVAALKRAIGLGQGWLQKNYKIGPTWQTFYYLYALERCMSFKELAEGKIQEEPGWYNDGVNYLRKSIRTGKDGQYWIAQEYGVETVDTAFAILFLLRASGKAIEASLGDGLLIGGHDLPDDLTNLTQSADGRIKKSALETSIDDILKDIDSTASLDNLPKVPKLSDKGGEREQQIAKLMKLISGENFEKRRFAVRALGRARSLDNVPPLIYAMTDPDKRIVREARDGLRFISRKFRGFRLPNDPTSAEITQGINNWKKWYLTIRPNADVEYLPGE